MIIRPIFTIVRLITILVLRLTGVNGSVSSILLNIFNFSSQVYSRFGFLSTIQSIFTIFTFLRNRSNITSTILNRRFLNNHPEIRSLILEYIAPNWTTMLNYRKRFFFVLASSLFTSILALINPIWFIRFFLGISISSIGILWNETLSSFDYLSRGAIYIINLLENFNFNIPKPNNLNEFKEFNNNNYITIFGLLLLGSVGIATSIILLEYYIPPVPVEEPSTYLGRLYNWLELDQLKNWWETINYLIYNYFPNIYDYLLIPIKEYLLLPSLKYLIQLPFNYSYDFLFHPMADAIRTIYDYLLSYFQNVDPRDPTSPRAPSSPREPISPISDVPDSMSSSTETIRHSMFSRSNSNNPFNASTSNIRFPLPNLPYGEDELPNPFNNFG